MPLGEQQEDANAIASIPTRDKVSYLINAHLTAVHLSLSLSLPKQHRW